MKEKKIKKCRNCGRQFRTQSKNRTLCDWCKAEKLYNPNKYKNNKQNEANRPIINYTGIVVRYNQKHGTNYSYGQFVSLDHTKKIKISGGDAVG